MCVGAQDTVRPCALWLGDRWHEGYAYGKVAAQEMVPHV